MSTIKFNHDENKFVVRSDDLILKDDDHKRWL